MKHYSILGSLLLAGIALAQPPNIVLIVADDLGYSDAGFTMDYAMAMRTTPGWDTNALAEVITPNMDRLADQGAVFTSGYVNGAVCSPTRAGLMLGRYQQRVAVYDAGAGGMGFNLYEDKSRTVSGNDYPRINPILPEFLRQSPIMASNYVCGVFGKWHLGIDGVYELENNGELDVGGRPDKQDTTYASIGGNFEAPTNDTPIVGVSTNYTDPNWAGGSPWHCANRGFDEWLYFMGRGAHDYWDPNEIYDAFDSSNILRRTTGLDARRNPGTGDDSVPTSAWDSGSPYAIHSGRTPTNYLTVRLGNAACDFIEQHAGGSQPFFCYVPFNAAHSPSQTPYQMDPSFDLLPLGSSSRHTNATVIADWFNPRTPDPDWLPDPLYMYEQYATNPAAFRYFSGGDNTSDSDVRKRCITLAMIQWMDKSIGQIAQKLRDPDGDGNESDSVYDNTIILFISDNGGASGMNAANAPLRGNKGNIWEGGIRSPFIFSWPDMLKAQNGTHVNDLNETVANQQLIHTPVIAMDFLPTLLDINHLDPLDPNPLLDAVTQDFYDYTPEGKSLMPLIRGEETEHHEYLFWAREDEGIAWGAVRKGDWKLHLMRNGDLELYNLTDDIAETTDLTDANPDLVRELRQAYFAFMDSSAAAIREPLPNSRLYTTVSTPPQSAGNGTVENFDYPVNSTLTNGISNGGANWLGAWNKTSTTDNGLIDAGSLSFNDPASNYVDSTEGHHYGARRKQIEINRAFSSSPVATPVWFSCLVNNMQDTTVTNGTHLNAQRWEFHPNNMANTYLRIGEGFTESNRFVAADTNIDLDIQVDLNDGTYLIVMRMETDTNGNNDSIKAWILPAGTAITGFSEADLGIPNLVKEDANLWANGLTSMGFIGDAYQNQAVKAAMIDNIRLSFATDATEEERLETLHSGSSEGGGSPTNAPSAITIHTMQTEGSTMHVEYDEIAGWLPGGATIETTTSLVSNDWTEVAADIETIDRWDGLITSQVDLPIDSETNRFYRLR